ncbi:MAG: hypothetical protein ACYDDS_19770 [Candidatus Sulfotelmatobacter sp.]
MAKQKNLYSKREAFEKLSTIVRKPDLKADLFVKVVNLLSKLNNWEG